jgi:peptidoglycan/xylan/chitin deacetylase (PgdA/CDA1 family)
MPAPSISVIVCSVGEAPLLDQSLSALVAAGVQATTVATGGRSLSLLRNTTLAECRSDVIAFVDDDVAVGRDWLEALTAAWDAADERVACIGGPIAVSVIGERPDWLSDQVARVYGAFDPGGAARALDASDQTLFSGNLSFRTSALRGIGGFWPARGAGRLRDWCSEEQHAQRSLARGGWTARYVPAAVATRIVDAEAAQIRELAVMQTRVSARHAMIGGGSRAGSAGPTLKSGIGVAIAHVRRNRVLVAERAIRGATSLGALAPETLAGDTLEPAASSTPLRFNIPIPPSGRKRNNKPGPRIVCYHRVCESDNGAGLSVTPAQLAEQLSALSASGPPATLEEIASGIAPTRAFAVTFDDGYADNLHLALPLLEAAGVPATFFIATTHVRDGTPFWWDELALLLGPAANDGRERGLLQLRCSGELRSWAPSNALEFDECRRHLIGWLQPQPPDEITGVITQLREWFGPDAPEPPEADRPMTIDELRTLAASPLATIGAHTQTHPCLRATTPERLAAELEGSRDDLTEWLGEPPTTFAYPFGIWGVDVDLEVIQAAEAAGYQAAVVNGSGPIRPTRFALGRLAP